VGEFAGNPVFVFQTITVLSAIYAWTNSHRDHFAKIRACADFFVA
jgi:hypothetical protein